MNKDSEMEAGAGGRRSLPYSMIAKLLEAHKVIPFLGAGASATVGRPPATSWSQGAQFFPLGSELAGHLARVLQYPQWNSNDDLPKVASYAAYVEMDVPWLREQLIQIFSAGPPPGRLHTVLASIEGPTVFFTTNYDELLENALTEKKQNYVVVVDVGARNKVLVRHCDQKEWRDVTANELTWEIPEEFSLVYKMHGSVVPRDPRRSHFLITEQDYVEFLGRGVNVMPPAIAARVKDKHFLFLGHSLEDWNVRVMLNKLRAIRPDLQRKSWSISRAPGPADSKIWEKRNVTMYDEDIESFADGLSECLKQLAP